MRGPGVHPFLATDLVRSGQVLGRPEAGCIPTEPLVWQSCVKPGRTLQHKSLPHQGALHPSAICPSLLSLAGVDARCSGQSPASFSQRWLFPRDRAPREDAVTAPCSSARAAGERLSARRCWSNPLLGRWYLAPPVSWSAGLDERGHAEGAEPACARETSAVTLSLARAAVGTTFH